MKVLVYPHDLQMGGSQLNAIELAAAVRDLGHEVLVYGQPGVLLFRVDELGVRFVQSPTPGRRPSPRVVRHLRALIHREGIDVVHGYEWPPILEARIACMGTAARPLGTVMSMAVAPFLPFDLPLVVGTRQIAAHERSRGRLNTVVIEPPVDLRANGPHIPSDVDAFRSRHDVPPGIHVVVVGRLAEELKGEGLFTAITEVPKLHPEAVLTVVGDGPGREQAEALAHQSNATAGRRAVVLTGEVSDPRPAYAMADVCLGMGGSALRSLAFAKPLIVQGEKGFWRTLTPDTAANFRWTGFYGVGDSPADGPGALADALRPLLIDPLLRTTLGQFGCQLVTNEFDLAAAAVRQVEVYDAIHRGPRALPSPSDTIALGRFAAYKAARLRSRLVGGRTRDDFNARPVAGHEDNPPAAAAPLVVWLAGVDHHAVEGTEHRLVERLSKRMPVLWVDPPASLLGSRRPVMPSSRLTRTGPASWRLHVVGVPGTTRPGLRALARRHQARAVRRACHELGFASAVAVVGDPWVDAGALPVSGTVFLATDDFVAGADLLGVDRSAMADRVARIVGSADVVLAVSPTLVEQLGGPTPRVRLFPNGCTPVGIASEGSGEHAVLVGQLNDRLDVEAVLAVVDRGVPLTVVGPRCEREEGTRAALDRLLIHPKVRWTGRVPQHEVKRLLADGAVGLTPYRDTAFNRASFPLKTLEYLASGLPVVSTNLPASRWLDTDLVEVTTSPSAFAEAAARRIGAGHSHAVDAECRRFASRHTWDARADELAIILGNLASPGTPPQPRP